MKTYNTEQIRNVGIVGHGDTGKTQLVSSLLFTAGMTQRLGKVTDGSTVTDWDEEEIARKISIQTGMAYAEWQAAGAADKTKINFLDTPGYSTFINDTKASLIAADAALILVDAFAGCQVVTEKVWDFATEYEQPRAFVINWMDRELASFERALESIQQVFGRGAVPVQLPIGAEKNFKGVVDLVAMKALLYTPDGDGKAKIKDIPADLAEAAKAAHEALVEMVAEGDDELMQELLLAELVLRGELVGRALRLIVSQAGDHTQIEERLVGLRLELVLRIVGVYLRGSGLLVHQRAFERGLQALVVGLRGLERELRVEQLLLELRVGHVQDHRIRSHLRAGQHANTHNRCVGLSRDQFDRVLARHQAARGGAHLANERTLLYRVGPDG